MRPLFRAALLLLLLQRPGAAAARKRRREADTPHQPPKPPIGTNTNLSVLRAQCPHRDYEGCWGAALRARYTEIDLVKGRAAEAAPSARRHFGACSPPPRSASAHGKPGEPLM